MGSTARNASGADHIGRHVMALRAQRGMRVSELARRVGVSTSLVSQIEAGRSRPSIATLFSLAEVLDVPVDAFFRPGPPPAQAPADPVRDAVPGPGRGGAAADLASTTSPWPADGVARAGHRYVVHAGERATLEIASGVVWERLTPSSLQDAEFLEIVYEPGAASHSQLYRHPGSEIVLVLEGRLEIRLGFESYVLQEGDSMQLPSSLPHRYLNPSGATTRAVTMILRDRETGA